MKFDELELQRKQSELEALVQNYKGVEQQLKLEGDAPRKNQLKDQLQMIGQQMNGVEREIEALQQKIQQTGTQYNTLISILQTQEEQFSRLVSIYQRVLTHWRCQVKLNPKSCKEMVEELLRIPRGRSPFDALAQFVGSLVAEIDNAGLVDALQSWGEQYIPGWESLFEWLEQRQEQQRQQAQPALLITVSRSDEASTQQGSDRYQIKGWLIQNISRYKQRPQGYTALNATEGDTTYSKEELQAKAPELLLQFLAECSNAYDEEPEIHIFLPLALLNQAVERWMLDDGYGQPVRLGYDYKVVIRCLERLGRSYRHRPRWVKKWQRHQSLLQKTATHAFMACDDSDLDTLFAHLNQVEGSKHAPTNDEGNVGLKLVQAPTQLDSRSVFGAILQFGFPLAIWGRCNLLSQSNEVELDRVLQESCLERLLDKVQQERRNCQNHPEDCHIGHHLALIWDDPDLVPPKSA